MKSCSQFYRFLSICAFLLLSVLAKAQVQDTILVDYTGNFCLICSDPDYNCKATDSLKFVDSSASNLRLDKIKFVFLHTPCTSLPTTLLLNGDTMGSWNNSYNCSCNSCTIDSVVVTGAKLASYMQRDTNNFLYTGGSNLCIARYMIIRTWVPATDYDMATNRLVGPLYACPGSRDIEVEVANYGRKQVDSVELHWTYNGVAQTTVKDTGTIDTIGGTGSFLKTIKLGSKSLVSGKTDTLVAWTAKPNGQNDTVNLNDTIKAYIRPALKDTLTVGGTSPDFAKIQDAFDALMLYGICGPVVLNVRTGTYNEQLSLGEVPGADTTNTITLRSETGDSTDVKIYYSGSSAMNYVLQLENTSIFRCKQLTLEGTGSSYARVVWFVTGNQNIRFDNCRIIGASTTGTGTNQALFYASPGNEPASHDIQITNCRFERGSYGIHFNNPWNDNGMGYRIEQCQFVDQSHRNIDCRYSQDMHINNNNLTRSSSGTSYGHNIYLNDCQGPVRIGCNVAVTTTAGIGIELSWFSSDTSRRAFIYNNFVSVTSPYSSSCTPLRLYYANHVRVAHNSLFAECTNTTNNAIYTYYGGNLSFTSNSVFNKNPGRAWYNEYSTSGSPNVIHSNHNNLYTMGSTLGFWNTSVANLSAWQTATGLDSNSVSADPGYKSSTDLHASAVELNGAADPTTGISDDIDKEPRDTMRPDIGADEYKLPPVDASLTELKKFKSDSSCIEVVLRNLGDDTLKSVSIAWTFDGVTQTSKSWTGALVSGDTAIVCVGYKKFKRDSAHDVKLWTTSPNGVSDTINSNDTITKRVFPALCGIYTIGGTSPDYATFNAALDALDSAGVLDSAVFRVRDGTYNEQLHIQKIECADNKNQVIFESENGDSTKVKLTTSSASWSNNYLIWLDGADGITFRKMTLENVSTWYKNVVKLSNGADYNELSNNIIQNNDSLSSSSGYALVYNESTGDHHFCLVNNRLVKGSYGYYARGSSSDHDRSTRIHGNLFEKQGYGGVDARYIKDFKFTSNRLTSNSNNYWASVNLDEASGNSRIEKNNLIGPDKSERYGFYLNDFDYGDSSWILNNFVSVGGTNTGCYAYHLEDFTACMFYNNSALCYTTDTNSSGAVFYEGGTFNSGNNNLICTNGGYGMYYNWGTLNSDYNNVRTPSAKFSYWTGSTYADLAAHITGTNNDSNSISQDPQFVSNSDLHITSPAMDKTGKSVSFVTDDIDGETRDTVPDIGADEFEPAKYDIGVTQFLSPGSEFAADTQQIKVVVFNFGTDTIFSGTIRTRFNNDTLPDKAFADTIVSGDSIHVHVGKYLFKADTLYTFMAWTSKPNGVTDQQLTNDTFKVKDKLAAMRGEYTIGGSTPDFTNFKLAIEALKLRGIVDSVKFKVRDGTYTEQLHIPNINGASGKNAIVFEGESKDSSLAKLTFAATKWDTNYTVRLDEADGITFRHLTLAGTGSSYGRVILFENGSDDLCIEHCRIEGVNVSTSSSNFYLITSGSQTDNGFVLRNSHLQDGSSALYFDAPWTYSEREKNTVVQHNTFSNFYTYGIYMNYQRGVKIIGNTMRTNSTTSGYQLIYLYYPTDSFCIAKNSLVHENNGSGIYCYYPGYSSGDSCLITNNTISIGNMTSSYYGMSMYYPRGVRIAHNSINVVGSSSGSQCLNMSGGGSSNTVLNNIFENQAGGYTMYYSSPGAITMCDYNNARTTGSNFGYYSSAGVSMLSTWRSTSGFDSSSTTYDPRFTATDDLHIQGVDLDGTVSRLPYVLTDIDGDSRDTLADVGADEIRLKGLDAGIARILVPNQPYKSDTQYVKVILKNFGSSTLYSADINYIFNNGATKVYKWSDTLASKDTAWVCIEKKFFDLDSSYSLKAWTSKPNNGTDSLATNDTAETVDQYPALSGPYTIGGASPDFVDFSAAIAAMKKGGIVDSVIFTVRNGTYTEQITIPRILGATTKNSIVFQSSGSNNTANVVLSFTATSWTNNWVVRLDSAVGVTFRRITLTNPGGSYSTIVDMLNNSDYNEFNACVFLGNTLSSSNSSYRYLVNANVSNSHNNDYNCFIGNTFTNGAVGIYTYGYNSGTYDKNWVIKNNTFNDQYFAGTYQRYADSIMVHGNIVEHAGSWRLSTNYGLYHQYIRGGFTFTSNVTKGVFARAAYLPSCDGFSTKYGLIANNMIHTSHSGAYGMYLDNSDYVYIYNNSIHTSSSGANRALYTYYGSNQHLVNNILVEAGTGYAWYHYGGSSSFTRSDYNDYYSAGTNVAYFNFSNRANLAALKTATGKDTSSLSVDPGFVDTDDLHVREITLNEAGTSLSEVPYDIDMEARDSTKPDIGADEFEPPAPEDAGILAFHGPMAPFKSGSQNVEVVLKNFGSDTLTSATILWTANGVSPGNYSWTGSLLPGKVDTVNIGSYTFDKVKAYNLVFWTNSPNGVTDTLNYNDTAKANDVYAALDTTYTIGSLGANFPDFSTAVSVLQKAGILDTVRFKVQTGTYTEQFSISSYQGQSASRPVIFESMTGDSTDVILTYSSTYNNNYLVRLSGAPYITFKSMTFKPTNYYYSNGIDISGGSQGVQLLNNRFEGVMNPYFYNASAIWSNSDNDDSCRIENNYFTQGNQAIQMYGLGSASPEKGTIIRNNRIENGARDAIYLQNQENLLITGNTIRLKSNTSTKSGIQVHNARNGMEVSCNNIASSGLYDNGILVNYDGSTSQTGYVVNNFIALKNNSGSRYGIYSSYSEYLIVGFNSVNIYGGTASSTYTFRSQYGSDIQVKNNIFCNKNGGYAFYQIGSGIVQSDRNDLYTTGTNLGFYTSNRTDLSAWKSATGKDANSLSLDPLFTANDNLHVYISSLDSAATPITGVTEDIDKDTRNTTHPDIGADEFNSLLHNLGVSAVVKPIDGCDIDTQVVEITIFNYGSLPQSNYSVCYSVDGGTAVKDTITDTIGPGMTQTFTFSTKHKFATVKTYTIRAWTKLTTDQDASNDTATASITNYATPGMVSSMFPLDTTKNIDYPITLSWAPATGASKYDIYIWDDTASSRPVSPFRGDVTQISTQISTGLTYGRTFKWQVVAKNDACGTDGPIQKFTMRYLPDLMVEDVSAPTTAFSGNSISISWKVKNIGGGPTGSRNWYDLVYLSTDTIFDNGDLYVGGKSNPSALNASSNYSQSLSVTLPNGYTGSYHAIVRTDAYSNILEANEGNNVGNDTSTMVVSLTPPPDLIVTNIVRPNVAISGTTININYTVKNDGTGSTRNGSWYDYIYWSDDSTFGAGATFLKSIRRTSDLDKDSTYTFATTINVPHFIQGRHYVYVKTDGSNQEYEHTSETNNVTRSDTIGVILAPPPDLVIANVEMPDTVSSCARERIEFETINEGGGSTMRGFNDLVYYSTSNVYSTSTITGLGSTYNRTMQSKDTIKNSVLVTIPDNLVGKYYLYVVADAYNRINENIFENNNVSPLDSFVVQAPDLIVSSVRTSKRDTTGDTTQIHYTIVNQGKGDAASKSSTDRIYISMLDTFNLDSCVALKDVSVSSGIAADDTVERTAEVRIPDGFDGNRYFYVYTDVHNKIFEDTKENNNTGGSDTVKITLAPYPDLIPTLISIPDTANAGDTATITYSVKNQGDTTAMANWMDRIYLSKDSIFDATSDQLLASILHTADLKKDSMYTIRQLVTLPSSTPAGDYYYFVQTDADNNVYEHRADTNNVDRGGEEYVDGYPPVDLKVTEVVAPDTFHSGKSTTVSWTVENVGDAATVAAYWEDCVYLSTDSFWSMNDIRVHTEQINATVSKDSSYDISATFTMPNGLSGDYYVLVRTDKVNANNDADTSNNTGSKRAGGKDTTAKVLLTPPPDLQVSYQTVPSTGTAGQQIKLVWKVVNEGSGPTTNGYWNDQIYLSTDYTVDVSDRRIGNKVRVGDLKKDSSYIDSLNVFIPGNFSGNYIIIIVTDGENREYEFDKEGNNTASSILTVSKAPPADLIVSSVTGVDSVVSGDVIAVNWTVKNIGLNPATGFMRDNIYLSSDSIVDATDKLLATRNYSVSLVQNATVTNGESVTISGVSLGDYYILVKSDVLNNINEANDTNNTGKSTALNVNIPELYVGVKKNDSLTNQKEKLYRIYVHDTLEGESMLVTLKADSVNGSNEMYIRKGEVPSRSEFDFGFSDPFKGNQEIIVPELDTGTYYLMVYGNTTAGSAQATELLARILEFEIRRVTPKQGGNTGFVTLKIEGSKFDENTKFYIGDESLTRGKTEDTLGRRYAVAGEVDTDTFLLVDPTVAYVVFDLREMEKDTYDVIAEKGDTLFEIASLKKGFEVVDGVPVDIDLNVTRPANARTNRIVSFSVEFTNKGNTDVVGGELLLISNGTTPIALTVDGLSNNKTSLKIPLQENEGIGNRLRPGASGSVKVYSKASNTLGFSIVLPE